MATAKLVLDLADITGPGKVGEILIRPLSTSENTAYWQADKPGRIPLKFNDETHASTDPAYTPTYTVLGEGKWDAVVQGAWYEFTVVRVNGTTVNETFEAQIPAGATSDFSDLNKLPAPLPNPVDLVDTTIATVLSGPSASHDVVQTIADTSSSKAVTTTAVTRSRTDRLRADGDSFTANGSTTSDSWALALGADLGMSVYRNGTSGELSGGVALRGGAIKLYLNLGTTSVAAGSGSLTGSRTTDVTPCSMRVGQTSVAGVLVGVGRNIPGTFSVDSDNTSRFTYSGLSTTTTISATVAQFIPDTVNDHRDETMVIWTGRNDAAFAWPNHATGTVAATRAMIAHSTASVKRVIVPSVCTGTSETISGGLASRGYVLAINAALKAAFPDYYYDVRRDLIDQGLALAGITPTANDLADIADDTVPRSLLLEASPNGLHPNNACRMVIAKLFRAELDRRGGVGTESGSLLTTSQATSLTNLVAASPKRYAAERYYTPVFATKASAAMTSGELRFSPFLLDRSTIIKGTGSQLAIRVQTAAAASSLRVGIYGTNANGLPGDLLMDAGTLDTTTTGTKTCSTSALQLPAGLYWLAGLALGGSPSIMQGTGSTVPISNTAAAGLIDQVAPGGYVVTGQSSLPTTAPTVTSAAACPVFGVIMQDVA